jgi:hypothetical protein
MFTEAAKNTGVLLKVACNVCRRSSGKSYPALCISGVRAVCRSPISMLKLAQKDGEVVEPAGGETGVPRCLAKDYKTAQSSLITMESIISPKHTVAKYLSAVIKCLSLTCLYEVLCHLKRHDLT